ncbi:MAG TPA: hypothetical protein VK961_16400 [Chthoniobacter sp.]|nr:hypothetical protein [Chthoniobacter sp.]
MAKVFIGIAMLFMLVTAGVGFMLKGNVDKLQSTLTATKNKIADAEGKARAAKADADKAQKEATAANEKATAAEMLAATKTKEADDAKTQAGEAKMMVDKLTASVADLEKKLVDAGAGKPDPTAMAAKDAQIAELTSQKQNADKELAEQKQLFESQVAKGKENEIKLAELQKKAKDREVGFYKAGIQGRVLAFNNGWNFAVVSVGDKQGVMVNQTLLVVRGNEPVARLRITSVEPSTSIADVLPGTVRKGASVQPGDTVIFEGGRTAPTQPGLPGKATPEGGAPVVPAAPQPALPNS